MILPFVFTMKLKNGNKIILASASPRRKELLEREGLSFDVLVPQTEEISDIRAEPKRLVTENARLKAESVARENPNRPVLGADTIVCLNGKIYGKPKDVGEAKTMLAELQGKTHSVFTGVCAAMSDGGGNVRTLLDAQESRVTFKGLDSAAIDEYIANVNVLDKAGSYAAQEFGSMIIEKIDGAFDNVMGLPVNLAKKILDRLVSISQSL